MFLSDIVKTKQHEVETLKSRHTICSLLDQIEAASGPDQPRRSFRNALARPGLQLIAEVKKASPSKGIIRADFDPIQLGQLFEENGAACLSVLTDESYFMGQLSYLSQVRTHVSRPLLRKEFIIDPIQIYESKLAGADAILLIKAILTNDQLAEFSRIAANLEMDSLVEIHSEAEFEAIRDIPGLSLIGINNRDLHTFELDMSVTLRLAETIKSHFNEALVVAESGYSTVEALTQAADAGCDAVLIGEGLFTHPELLDYFRSLHTTT